MRSVRSVGLIVLVFAIAGCATQDPVETDPEPVDQAEDLVEEAPAAPEPSLLEQAGIAGFALPDGSAAAESASVSLATGGGSGGRLIPQSSDSGVLLYMTRDGSVPSADNNWGGPIDPGNPPVVTRQSEGSGVYKLVAALDGEYSEVFTVFVTWVHEADPAIDAPEFTVGGRAVSGAVEIPVSDGTVEENRLYISTNYTGATLYITRDGTDPTTESFWKSQVADGTYLFSPEPTTAAYRAMAVWQGVQSSIAALDVAWTE